MADDARHETQPVTEGHDSAGAGGHDSFDTADDPALVAAVDALVADAVSDALAPVVDLRSLHDEAVRAAAHAVARAEQSEREELLAMGRRFAQEQEELYNQIMAALPDAVRAAAGQGRRVATVLRFGGSDRLREFCYLYMLKGPHRAEQRAEMQAMGVEPLLPRLRRELRAAGFGAHHAWQRATNDNTLSVTW